ncbi:MAG TPA: thioredoxin-disulfide reductase [Candidatus Omnitrophota bacterium]|nr:thioredoxin-disulfide reductase [Candidatus Omnitrophota bacterium]HRK62148.1 thioredoxin-disulfide reductase [Candidatus Omnitrophota bacterium]
MINQDVWDVLIIGGGGSGMTAALYASRANLKTGLFEKLVPGGQIAVTDMVENYPGFPEGVLGPDIAMKMQTQAEKYGTKFFYDEVLSIQKKEDKTFELKTASESFFSKTIILAMGASFRMLNVPMEKELTGKGVSYCATCDGAFFKGKEVVVVGGGDSALQEGIFLTRFATQVTVVHRRDSLRASPILQDRAKTNPKIKFIWDTVVEKVVGKDKVEGVVLKNLKTQATTDFKTDGLFVFVGHDPNSKLVRGVVNMNDHGYVLANGEGLQTSVEGIFAAGEIRFGAVKQLVTACGEGCEAALSAQAYLEH